LEWEVWVLNFNTHSSLSIWELSDQRFPYTKGRPL
jgi:hypothetical protein